MKKGLGQLPPSPFHLPVYSALGENRRVPSAICIAIQSSIRTSNQTTRSCPSRILEGKYPAASKRSMLAKLSEIFSRTCFFERNLITTSPKSGSCRDNIEAITSTGVRLCGSRRQCKRYAFRPCSCSGCKFQLRPQDCPTDG